MRLLVCSDVWKGDAVLVNASHSIGAKIRTHTTPQRKFTCPTHLTCPVLLAHGRPRFPIRALWPRSPRTSWHVARPFVGLLHCTLASPMLLGCPRCSPSHGQVAQVTPTNHLQFLTWKKGRRVEAKLQENTEIFTLKWVFSKDWRRKNQGSLAQDWKLVYKENCK